MAKIRDKPRPGITVEPEQSITGTIESTRKPHGFQPGVSGNPAGRPKSCRNKLSEEFFKSLMRRFEEEGDEIINALPVGEYLAIVQSVVPLQVEVEQEKLVVHLSATHLTDDEWAARWAEPSSVAATARSTDSIN